MVFHFDADRQEIMGDVASNRWREISRCASHLSRTMNDLHSAHVHEIYMHLKHSLPEELSPPYLRLPPFSISSASLHIRQSIDSPSTSGGTHRGPMDELLWKKAG